MLRYTDPPGWGVAAGETAVDQLEQIVRGERLGQNRADSQPLRGLDDLSRFDMSRDDDEAWPPLRAVMLDVLEKKYLWISRLHDDR